MAYSDLVNVVFFVLAFIHFETPIVFAFSGTKIKLCNKFSDTLRIESIFPVWSNEKNSAEVSYGPDSFGSIMSGCETTITLNGNFTPIERIVLSANGNLQLIMSAYYGAPVFVNLIKCQKSNDGVYDREVELVCNSRIFCVAKSRIELLCPPNSEVYQAIDGGRIGIGQLFRYLGKLPTFRLYSSKKDIDGTLSRDYSLSVSEMNCRFVETFTSGFTDIDFIKTA